MKFLTGFALALALSTIATGGSARNYVSPDEARRICSDRAIRFSDSIRGPDGDFPDNMSVVAFYRSCFRAKSGHDINARVVFRPRTLFNLQRLLVR